MAVQTPLLDGLDVIEPTAYYTNNKHEYGQTKPNASSNRIFRTSCSSSVRLMAHLLVGGPHETGQSTCYYTGQTTCS